MSKPSRTPQNELTEIRKRAEETEIRARELEAQVRLIEARMRLAQAQAQWRDFVASEKNSK